MGWISIAGKVLEYSGRLAQAEGFEEWATSVAKDRIDSWATNQGFRLFKNRRGRTAWWKELRVSAENGTLRAAIEQEVSLYQQLPASLASRNKALPRTDAIKPIIVVPRFLLNVIAYDGVVSRLGKSDELRRLSGGEALSLYFIKELVRQLDTALVAAGPTLKSPLPAAGKWFIIGQESHYAWADESPGHYYLFESWYDTIDTTERERCADDLQTFKACLGRLSSDQKKKIMGNTVTAMTQ